MKVILAGSGDYLGSVAVSPQHAKVVTLSGQSSGTMNLSKYQCPDCGQSQWETDSTCWKCEACGQNYPLVNGIPKLYLDRNIEPKDRELRDYFYEGLLGKYYQHVMPFLSLPARPARISWNHWVAYVAVTASLLALILYLVTAFMGNGYLNHPLLTTAAVVLFVAICYFFFRHPYLLYVLVLAIPVKISLILSRFKPVRSFMEIHDSLIGELLKRDGKLQVLDIATGTCNSLYRHGWMKLDAEYTGVDLSETMLLQGREFMSREQVPVDFALADASRLPFKDASFDVVLNYGALNGFSDPHRALEEMDRVTRKNGVVLFFDEQLYQRASFVERLYFDKVLSSHNIVHRCPVESVPAGFIDVQVHQVYQFYYLCLCRKK